MFWRARPVPSRGRRDLETPPASQDWKVFLKRERKPLAEHWLGARSAGPPGHSAGEQRECAVSLHLDSSSSLCGSISEALLKQSCRHWQRHQVSSARTSPHRAKVKI